MHAMESTNKEQFSEEKNMRVRTAVRAPESRPNITYNFSELEVW